MAAPPSVSIKDLSGTFTMNHTLSDPFDPILRLQGLSWLTRTAISAGVLTLHITHYTSPADGAEHVDIAQSITSGIPGTTEPRVLDWTLREHWDPVFGYVVSRSRRMAVGEVEDGFLGEGWREEAGEDGVIYTVEESDTPKSGYVWRAEQVWGFEDVDGARRYTRHAKVTGPKGEVLTARLVYDYITPPES